MRDIKKIIMTILSIYFMWFLLFFSPIIFVNFIPSVEQLFCFFFHSQTPNTELHLYNTGLAGNFVVGYM